MKKYVPIIFASLIGLFFGSLLFDSYEEETVMTSDGNVYMLQYGAYTSESVMLENVKKLDKSIYIIDKVNDIYYVYLGITGSYDNALMIVKLYESKNVFLYIKEEYLGKSNLIKEIKKLDSLIKEKNNLQDITGYLKNGLNLYQKSY